MKSVFRISFTALALSAAAFAAPVRKVGDFMFSAGTIPPEAQKKGVIGNVVLSGDIGVDSRVTGITILASSSPLLNDAAVKHLQQSKFSAGTEDGKTVPLILNAVVRFRNDRAKIRETGSMPAPILGNFSVTPTNEKGQSSGPEGFFIGPSDHGVRGVLDIDLPKGSAGRKFHLVVTDRFPGGKSVMLLDKTTLPEGSGTSLSASVYRPIDARHRDERGIHTLTLTIDGTSAGGARYRVGSPPSGPAKRPRTH